MSGNHQVRFLGEDVIGRSHPYPTHDGGSIVGKCALDDFPRMDGGAVDRAAEEILNSDQAVPAVEMEHTKDFMLASAQVNPEELASQRRRGQHWGADPVALCKERLSAIENVGCLGLAKTGLVADIERGHDGGPSSLPGGIARCPRPTPQRSRQ
jgi:hypothetical protein